MSAVTSQNDLTNNYVRDPRVKMPKIHTNPQEDFLIRQFLSTAEKVTALTLSIIATTFIIPQAITWTASTMPMTVSATLTRILLPGVAIIVSLAVVLLKIRSLLDNPYENEAALQQYRENAKTRPLEETLSSHGIEVFNKAILSSEEFRNKYNEAVESLFADEGIFSVIRFYEDVSRMKTLTESGKSYEIPTPSVFRDRWDEETKEQSLTDMTQSVLLGFWAFQTSPSLSKYAFSDHNIDSLLKHGILQDPGYAEDLKRLCLERVRIEEEYVSAMKNLPSNISKDFIEGFYEVAKTRLEEQYKAARAKIEK